MKQTRVNVVLDKGFIDQKKYVVYWMQQAQRIEYNHALSYAIEEANKYKLPLLVIFVINPSFPGANARHFTFMLEGIQELKNRFHLMGITFIIKVGPIVDSISPYLHDAISLIMDYGYLKIQKKWREDVLADVQENHHINAVIVETDLVVSFATTTNKLMYSARTIRPLLHKLYLDYCHDYQEIELEHKTLLPFTGDTDLVDISDFIQKNNIDRSVFPSAIYHGGYQEAVKTLNRFICTRLHYYHLSSDPSNSFTSTLSMYLHFGQISTIEIINTVTDSALVYGIPQSNIDQFIEQILVRRELAFNFVSYQPEYDSFEFCTDKWAYETMQVHLYDEREYIYTIKDYEEFKTHDKYFNAAMKEMVYTGFMHNYMRMYWAKKIVEWSHSYISAYETIKYLNDKYFIDGRDPNSYAGIAWIFGKHDRAWTERPIFGKLRYMNANGLKRKFDIDEYVKKCDKYLKK
ncbi:MAG: deoxyribodipyrimidine photo-lyase [Bacilli bacterium]|nr:deoxyribodipyrimidine photo-lyase [Bacilli bacterium]